MNFILYFLLLYIASGVGLYAWHSWQMAHDEDYPENGPGHGSIHGVDGWQKRVCITPILNSIALGVIGYIELKNLITYIKAERIVKASIKKVCKKFNCHNWHQLKRAIARGDISGFAVIEELESAKLSILKEQYHDKNNKRRVPVNPPSAS